MRKIRTRALSILSVGLITLFSQTASAQAGGDAGHGVNSKAESGAGHAKRDQFWWPQQLDLSSLRDHARDQIRSAQTFTTQKHSRIWTSPR